MVAPRQDGSSARKLLRILLSFDAARPSWTVADLAANVGVPLSTAYRYVGQLRDEGLLEVAPGSDGVYRLGPRAAALGHAAAATDSDLVALARPHLAALRDAVDETVVLVRRAGDSVVCIDRAESRHPVRLQYELGQTMPGHLGSAARVLLAHLPEQRRDAYLEQVRADPDVPATAMLDDESLAKVRESGWTESYEEVDEGIWGCAAAVRDTYGVVAAIGVAGPLFRLDTPQRHAAVAAVRQAADAVTEALLRQSAAS